MEWFLACLGRAFEGTEVTLGAVLRNVRFWEKYARVQVNDRQRDVINRLLHGFTGKLTTTKWAKLETLAQIESSASIQCTYEGRARGHRSSINQRIARAPATTRVFPQETLLDEALDITERGVVRALLEPRPLRCRQLPGEAVQ